MLSHEGYIVGERGQLYHKLVSALPDWQGVPSTKVEAIEPQSRVLYTSFKKGNSKEYKNNPGIYLSENLVHLSNVVNLLVEKKCKVYFIGSTSGFLQDGSLNIKNESYGVMKSFFSIIAEEVRAVNLINIITPTIFGANITSKPQMFEEVINDAVFNKSTFLEKYARYRSSESLAELISQDEAVQKIKAVIAESDISGNILIKPRYKIKVGMFYEIVHEIIHKENLSQNFCCGDIKGIVSEIIKYSRKLRELEE